MQTRREMSSTRAYTSLSSSQRAGSGSTSSTSDRVSASASGEQQEPRRKLLIVDGTALLYRAHHAYAGLRANADGSGQYTTTTVTGENDEEYTRFQLLPDTRSAAGGGGGDLTEETGASYGFLRMLLPTLVRPSGGMPSASQQAAAAAAAAAAAVGGGMVVAGTQLFERHRDATHLAVCFDSNVKTFRHELFPQYKRNRADRECPNGVIIGKQRIGRLLRMLGVAVFESEEGYEADDIIGTLAERATSCGVETEIFSGDKDFMQLLRRSSQGHAGMRSGGEAESSLAQAASVSLLRPMPRGGGLVHYTYDDFVEEHNGLEPERYVDVLALSGDASDGIPGLHRVGVKTALKLLSEWGSVEGIFENGDKLRRKDVRASVTAEGAQEEVDKYKRVVTIDRNVKAQGMPAEGDVRGFDAALKMHRPRDNGDEAMSVLADMEFFSLIEMIEHWLESLPAGSNAPAAAKPTPL